jgi:hypothetical protein
MAEKIKLPNRRDEACAPLVTSANIDERLAGAPFAPKVAPKPAPPISGTSVTPGQATEG